jgi:monoamine oxidase
LGLAASLEFVLPFSRRQFLNRVAALGGTGAVYTVMQTMGLLAPDSASARPSLSPTAGRGAKVVVLGAGIAGLVSAYELERAGFEVTILEARSRVGGRNWSVRNGTRIEMVGEADQTANFAESLYFNAGPARIPSHHQALLEYCKILGVPLEVEVNSSRSAYILPMKDAAAPPLRMRRAINDTRGHLSELLAKAINKGSLDDELTAADKAQLRPFLKFYGDLDDNMIFKGAERSGLTTHPGAANQFSQMAPPMPLGALLANDNLGMTLFEDMLDMQATMFQPVGGMDQIPAGFKRAIKSRMIQNAEVRSIRTAEPTVTIGYRDTKTGAEGSVTADYAIVTIPLVVLAKVDTDFDKPVKDAIVSVVYDHSNKIAFTGPRFWERDQIYGGLSFAGGENGLVWYPSYGLHSDNGLLVGSYVSGAPARAAARRPLAEQIANSRAVIDRFHPGHGKDLDAGVVINWSKVPFNMGPWPNWKASGAGDEGHNDVPAYRLLNQPHGRIHFPGAHLSQTPGCQIGVVLSAHRTIASLAERTAAIAA